MYLVKYSGPFGYIKPWTAVRDSETYSQQFLNPSTIEGIEKKLFPHLLNSQGIHKIKRYRLTYSAISLQQEKTQSRGLSVKVNKKAKSITFNRAPAVLKRGVLINPVLYLAFDSEEDALSASNQHICLCRNEDILLPASEIISVSEEEFSDQKGRFPGFELVASTEKEAFMVGFNRFNNSEPMYGELNIIGENPLSDGN
ncbi:MAG: hypothetical protein GX452_14275 [Ignavibacteriales bacterium]|nr:hypothetical protein [Ignavibacteriales bacterium]